MNAPAILAVTAIALVGCGAPKSPPPASAEQARILPEAPAQPSAPDIRPAAPRESEGLVRRYRKQIDDSLRKIESDPRAFHAYMSAGTAYRALGDMRSAARFFENASLVNPQEAEIILLLARTLLDIAEHSKAVDLYRDLANRYPGNPRVMNSLAAAHRMNKEYDQAAGILREILNTDKTDVDAINNLGLIYYQTGRHELAEITLQKAKKINPSHPDTFNNLGLTYLALELPQNAIREFKEAHRLKSDFLDSRLNLADLYIRHGNARGAAEEYEHVLRVRPLHIQAAQNLGAARLALGQAEQARNSFLTVLDVEPRNSEGLWSLGLLHHGTFGDPEGALAYFKRFTAATPDIPRSHAAFGYIRQLEKALEDRRKREAAADTSPPSGGKKP